MSVMSQCYSIIIDRGISAPGRGKEVVDGFNNFDKSYIYQLMYMHHRHIVCGESHICHDLDLDQNLYDNAYPTPLLHEALDVNYRMIML